MDVIIFADRKGQELLPLTDECSIALLPLAGKMVLEHTLDALVGVGIREAHVVLSPYVEQVKAAFGNGERWGMTLTYSVSRGEGFSIQEELARIQKTLVPPFLVLRGDIIRSGELKDFLQKAEEIKSASVQALYGGENAYMTLCYDPLNADFDSLKWAESKQQVSTLASVDVAGVVARLDSLKDFHQANLDAASGEKMTLLIPGRQSALGLTQGRNTEVYPQNLKQGIALIGSNCHLHSSVELLGQVVIGDNVIVDRRATIESSVILPHTYIGELVEIRNAIVRGNDLIRVDNGSIMKISDTFLLADLKTTTINNGLSVFFNRFAGVSILLISLPLWPLALGLSLLKKPGRPYNRYWLRGNKKELNDFGIPERAEFSVGEWNVDSPVLRYLPRILAVVSGDLNLVGALPVSLETASQRTEDWEKLADRAPAGLLGPTQLNLSVDATDDEKLMSDSFYAAHSDFRQDLRYIVQSVKSLFSSKAWFKEK